MHVHLFRLRPRCGRRSAHWYAQLYLGGKRYRFTCHTPRRAVARAYAEARAKELRERFERGLAGLPEPTTLAEAVARWEREEAPTLRPASAKRTREVLADAVGYFVPQRRVASLTAADVAAWLDSVAKRGVSARTVNLYRANLHHLLRLCVRPWLLIGSNPVALVERRREEGREPRVLSDAEYASLVAACGRHAMLRLFCVLAWETAGRSGELLQLQWADVDFARGMLTFRNDAAKGRRTKGRRSRTIPLSAAALDALREHAARFRLAAPSVPHIFMHLYATQRARPGDRLASLYHSFKSAAKRAGLPATLRPHDLRHSAVTRWLAAGVPVQLVSEYVGHKDVATTLGYTHLVPEHLRAVVQPPAAAAHAGGEQ